MKRRFAYLGLSALVGGLFIGQLICSPTQPSQVNIEPPPLEFEQITAKIYVVKGGSGANAGLYLGAGKTLLIDAKMSQETAREMLEKIAPLSSNPIGYVALTHSDGDHVNGLIGFPAGIQVIAHENTRQDLEQAFQDEKLRAHLPQITFTDKLELKLGEDIIQIFYFGPAHTNGDAIVYFPAEKVVFIGDLFFQGRDPLIHRHKNGSSFGLVRVLKAVLDLGAETFLSGHANRATRSDIEAFIQSLEEKQARIRSLIAEGKPLEDIKKVFGVVDRPAQPGRPRWLSLPEVIFLELTEKK